jgi:hypothetical protein
MTQFGHHVEIQLDIDLIDGIIVFSKLLLERDISVEMKLSSWRGSLKKYYRINGVNPLVCHKNVTH